MMRILYTCILLFSFALGTQGQQIMRTYYEVEGEPLKEEFNINSKGELHGKYSSYYENGAVKNKGYFVNNVSIGDWSYYYESGELRMIGNVTEGKNNGLWEYYYESGGKKMEGHLVEGKRSGNWVIFSANGTKQSEGRYEDNLRVGIWKYYASSGGLKASEEIKDDFSIYTEYYISGEKKAIGKKFNDEKQGGWLFYYEDGSLQAKGVYKEGKKFGPWKYYAESGLTKAEGNYINDLTDGIWIHYFESGAVKSKGKLYKGQKDGEWSLFYENGTLKGEAIYELGNGDYKEYYKSGALKLKGKVANGRNQGNWKYYYESGYLEGECNFRNGVGEFIGYYAPSTRKQIKEGVPGARKMKGLIKDDRKVGIWELYESNEDLAGYYKPYYEGENEGFWLANDKEEQKILSAEKRKVRIGSYRYSNSGNRYFKSKLNEYRAYIVNYNPIAVFYNIFPVALEYYMNERLGYELILQYIRNPFLKEFSSLEDGKTYTQGFSTAIRQKFYQRGTDFGVPYFAHELRYTYLQHATNIMGSSLIGAYESKYEYAILIGFRYFKNEQDNGFTIDVFLGTGAGYRDFNQTYQSNSIVDPFSNLNSNILSLSLRAGFHLGYTFKTRKF